MDKVKRLKDGRNFPSETVNGVDWVEIDGKRYPYRENQPTPPRHPQDGFCGIVTFKDGTEAQAYYNKGKWTVGVANDPEDVEISWAEIDSWRLA